MGTMARFVIRTLVVAAALWVTASLLPGVRVVPFGDGGTAATIATYLLVAVVFGVVNGVLGTVVRVLAFPLYVLTLGLVSFLVNGFLLLVVAWLSGAAGFGLEVDGFWWGVAGALLVGIAAWLITVVIRPVVDGGRGRRP